MTARLLGEGGTFREAAERLAWLQHELARFTYRPGWVLSIEGPDIGPGWGFFLRISYPAADAYHPERMITARSVRPVPGLLGPKFGSEGFGRWLAHELMEVERHESREWLRREGLVFDDPHDQTGDTTPKNEGIAALFVGDSR